MNTTYRIQLILKNFLFWVSYFFASYLRQEKIAINEQKLKKTNLIYQMHQTIHLDGKQLEKLKQAMVRTLLERKVFHNSRYRKSGWFLSLVFFAGLTCLTIKVISYIGWNVKKAGIGQAMLLIIKEKHSRSKKRRQQLSLILLICPLINDGSNTGRLRWKIDNEGFNTLKNEGYGMQHKWARKNYQGLKNYFGFIQIGYLINQLMVKSRQFQKEYLQGKNHPSLQSIWEDLNAVMTWVDIEVSRLKEILEIHVQYRFIS